MVPRTGDAAAGPAPARLRLHRVTDSSKEKGEAPFTSEEVTLDGEGGFVVGVELLPRRPNVFRIEAVAADGMPVAVDPASITIVQGLTVSDPPLSRSVGVALASDRVRIYFERGTPLPARRIRGRFFDLLRSASHDRRIVPDFKARVVAEYEAQMRNDGRPRLHAEAS